MKKRTVCVICTLAALLLLTFFLTALVRPKRTGFGSLWEQYLNEPRDSMDILYFGSSFMYCGMDPVAAEDEGGLCGFNMAGGEQIMSVTYRYVREALLTQKPRYAVIDLNGVFFVPANRHVVNNIEYMPWGENKLAAIFESLEPKERFGVFFPIYNYHDMIARVTSEDILWLLRKNRSETRGYTRLDSAITGMREEPDIIRVPATPPQVESNYRWLIKTVEHLEENGVTPVLIFVPCWGIYPEKDRDAVMQRLALDAPGARLMDFSGLWGDIGLDRTRDFYDLRHLNVYGAEKFSRYFARWLNEK